MSSSPAASRPFTEAHPFRLPFPTGAASRAVDGGGRGGSGGSSVSGEGSVGGRSSASSGGGVAQRMSTMMIFDPAISALFQVGKIHTIMCGTSSTAVID